MARRELAARAGMIILLVKPEVPKAQAHGGKKPRSFYFNVATKQSSWTKPKCFGKNVLKEVTIAEARKKTRRFNSRSSSKQNKHLKVIFNVNLTYPLRKEDKRNLAVTYIQCMARATMARIQVRWIVWNVYWKEVEDYETGEMFYSNNITGVSKWEKPWEPRVYHSVV
jgi:hypothetical protein